MRKPHYRFQHRAGWFYVWQPHCRDDSGELDPDCLCPTQMRHVASFWRNPELAVGVMNHADREAF